MNKSNHFYLFCLAILLLLLTARTSFAQIQLRDDTPRLDVSQQLHVWIDTLANETIESVAALPAEQLVRLTGPMSLGFTRSVVWIRIRIEANDSPSQTRWVLELDQPLLQNVQMFWQNEQGQWSSQVGTRLGHHTLIAYDYRRPVFDLPTKMNDGTVWLRIQTQTSMSSAFYLWQYDAFVSSRAQESFLWGLVFGSYLFVIVFYALYSIWNRNRLHAIYTLYISGNLAAAWFTGNWTALTGWHLSTQHTVLAMGMVICWVNFLAVLFNNRLLRLDIHQPLIAKLLLASTVVIGLVGSIGVLLGYYSTVIPLVQTSAIALIVLNIYLGVVQLHKHNPNASLFLWGFAVFYAGVVVRYLRNMGWLEPNFWTEHSYQIGSFVHMIIMSVGIFSSYNRLQRERNDALALADAEHKQREQQAEFLGLVSHELRTPLTIVSAAADNMAQQSALDDLGRQRLNKIQRATERMRHIIDGYLNAERLASKTQRYAQEPIDLLTVCRQSIKAAQEKLEHPVRLHLDGVGDFKMTGDALQIQVAIDNLLSNAQSHTSDDAAIDVHLRTNQDALTIEVVNKGDPIDPTDLPHLFERFYRGRNAKHRPGSGLGLHLVQVVAAMHHGHVLAENLPSGHCRFTLVLGRA
jgi:two-component system, sensor histidine kinase LadS